MKVLVACEESQAVCKAFRALGHEAYSCDLKPCSGGHPEWHIQCDALKLLSYPWDLVIAHPPCTYLSNAGARHLYKNHVLQFDRYNLGVEAASFFYCFLNCSVPRVCVENPLPSKVFGLPAPSQVIQPYMFGHPFSKRTLLWLKNLPLLVPTDVVKPVACWCPSGSYVRTHSAAAKGQFTRNRAENRSKTFPGVASAMAAQWGCLLEKE